MKVTLTFEGQRIKRWRGSWWIASDEERMTDIVVTLSGKQYDKLMKALDAAPSIHYNPRMERLQLVLRHD